MVTCAAQDYTPAKRVVSLVTRKRFVPGVINEHEQFVLSAGYLVALILFHRKISEARGLSTAKGPGKSDHLFVKDSKASTFRRKFPLGSGLLSNAM
jgi:hypothetical protein